MSAFISPALIDQDRADFRRWSFSAMLAVALHGAVAMTALTWYVANKPLDANGPSLRGPVFIDLAPPSAAPSSEQTLTPPSAAASSEQSLAQPQSGSDRAAVRTQPIKAIPEAASALNRDSSGDPRGQQGPQRSEAEPSANGLTAAASTSLVPADDAAMDSGGAAAASRALATPMERSPVGVSHTLRVDPGPLDTSITALPAPLRPPRPFGAFGHNRAILLRPLRQPGKAGPSHSNPSGPTHASGDQGHAPGAHMEDRVNAAIERDVLHRIERARNGAAVPGTNSLGMRNGASSPSLHDNSKNAIGAGTGNNGVGSPESGVINGTAKNAVGMTVPAHPNAPETNADERREGVTGLKAREGIAGLKAVAAPGGAELTHAGPLPGVLNGRGMTRPGMALSVLGGPPKIVPGALSGSDFHPKHQQ